MTNRSSFAEARFSLEGLTEAESDYAAEYRSNVQNVPGTLKGVARIGVDSLGVVQEVGVPAQLRCHRYIGPMIAVINSPESGITASRVPSYKRAFEYIVKVAVSDEESDWRYFGRALLKRLKSELTSEYTIKASMDDAKRLFNKAADKSDYLKVKREIRTLIGGKGAKALDSGYWPNLRAVERYPTRSLEDVFGDSLNYTNEQYIDAVTDYASAFIRKWSDVRKRLRHEHPELYAKICDAVTRIGVERLKKIERTQAYSPRVLEWESEWFEILSINIEILVSMDDAFLNAIAMSQWRKSIHFERFSSAVNLAHNGAAGFADQLLKVTASCLYPKSQWSIWENGGKGFSLMSRLMFSLLDFLGPSLEEETCLVWLLASRRIQLSNTVRLKRAQIDEDATGIWIRSFKGRSGKAENVCIKKNTRMGRALKAYLWDYDQRPSGSAVSEAMISPYRPQTARFTSTWNFHHLAFSDHSEGLNEYGLSDASLMVVKQIYLSVVQVRRQNGRAFNFGDVERRTAKALLPSAIAQSHVYAEEAKRGGFIKSPTLLKTYYSEDPDELSRKAKNEFHTVKTREEIYRSRSRDKVKLRKGRAFAAAVSEEMANISHDIIGEWEERTSPFSVSALVDFIGLRGSSLEAPPETILAAAKAEKFIVEKSGLIKKDGMIYLFDSGLTARMMMEEVRHIEGELESLFATQDLDKAINAWAKLNFLELILKRFSAVSLKDASEKYGHLEGRIPHAPISEGGNSWIVE